jgi:hypothetical protein
MKQFLFAILIMTGLCFQLAGRLHAAEPECGQGPVMGQEDKPGCPIVDRPRFRLR